MGWSLSKQPGGDKLRLFSGVGVIVEEGTAGRYQRSELLGIKATGAEAGGPRA